MYPVSLSAMASVPLKHLQGHHLNTWGHRCCPELCFTSSFAQDFKLQHAAIVLRQETELLISSILEGKDRPCMAIRTPHIAVSLWPFLGTWKMGPTDTTLVKHN